MIILCFWHKLRTQPKQNNTLMIIPICFIKCEQIIMDDLIYFLCVAFLVEFIIEGILPTERWPFVYYSGIRKKHSFDFLAFLYLIKLGFRWTKNKDI